MFKNKSFKIVIFEVIIIIFSLVGITYGLKYIMDSFNFNISTSSLAIAGLNEQTTSGELIPLMDSSITKDTTDNVLRMTFNVKGAVTNTDGNYIYDIVLKDIVADCTLMNNNIKWNLYKNNELLSTGSLSPSFDKSIFDNKITLTNTQEDLKLYSTSGDDYIFILWMSEPCTSSDITTCTDVLNNDDMLGKTVSASIDVRLYTGKKKAISRSTTLESDGCRLKFYNDDWETIVNNINTDRYNVGDTKCIALDGFTNTNDSGCDNGEFLVRIANKSTPAECSGDEFSQTACGFVVEFVDIITGYNMNTTDTNVGSWPTSAMYTYVNDSTAGATSIYNALPSDLRSIIINTKSVTGYGSTESTNFTSTDKLYLLSPVEVWGENEDVKIYDSAYASSRQLDYYQSAGVTLSNYGGAVKQYQGSNESWWLRAPYPTTSYGFWCVDWDGYWDDGIGPAGISGVGPAFRIG